MFIFGTCYFLNLACASNLNARNPKSLIADQFVHIYNLQPFDLETSLIAINDQLG
jgi:hypothetical protein